MKSVAAWVFRGVLWLADRTPLTRRLAAHGLAGFYRSRGAAPVIVDDAIAQVDDQPLITTRNTMQWAAALKGGAKMPSGFRPDRRLRTDEGREAALAVIDDRLRRRDNRQLRRHKHYLSTHVGPDDPQLVEFVETALDRVIGEMAVSAPNGGRLKTKHGFAVLLALTDALEAQGMRPFLVSGTLLGVVRQGGLLEHDYDLDIGLLPGDGDPDRVAEIIGGIDGFKVTKEAWRVYGSHRSGVDFDVFLHYEQAGRYYHSTRIHAWWNSPFELEDLKVDGHDFAVPVDVDTYLTENYGDWSAPVAYYHKSFDTPNREYRRTAEALLYLYELVINSAADKDRFVCESAVRELEANFGIDLRHHFSASPLLGRARDVTV